MTSTINFDQALQEWDRQGQALGISTLEQAEIIREIENAPAKTVKMATGGVIGPLLSKVKKTTKKETKIAESLQALQAGPHWKYFADRKVADGTYTVSTPKGTHRTFKISTGKPSARFPDVKQFVSLLSGSNNEEDFQYIGWIDADGNFSVNRKVGESLQKTWSAMADMLLSILLDQSILFGTHRIFFAEQGYSVLSSSRCVRCGRKLTVPSSIYAGLGPECVNKGFF